MRGNIAAYNRIITGGKSQVKKFRAGIIGATGTVGRRLAFLLENHPFFEVTALAASVKSAGKTYETALEEKRSGGYAAEFCRGGGNATGGEACGFFAKIPGDEPCPRSLAKTTVFDAEADFKKIAAETDVVFCAVNAGKETTKLLEEKYARAEIPVISNNSANRFTPDVPMIIPEVNPMQLDVIPFQKRRLGTKRGFIATKSNCSVQTFAPLLEPLRKYGLRAAAVCTYQAVSGAGKTLDTMPEIYDNVIPYIAGEEEKSEIEPLKIWGNISDGKIVPAAAPCITAQCVRVPVSDGHTAAVFISFENESRKPAAEDIIREWENFRGEPQRLHLPSAPERPIRYFYEADRPQPRRDRMTGNGMSVCAGRLRKDNVFDYKFISLAHNSLRGAAGGSVLLAELLAAKGYLDR